MSRQLDRNWPPLVIVENAPRWFAVRDFFLTTLMWLVFLFMLEGELDVPWRPVLERLGLEHLAWPAALPEVGLADFGGEGDFVGFLYALAPYLALALLLIVTLLGFGVGTISRRRRGLRGAPPPPLRLAVEAHQAELGSQQGGLRGAAGQARRTELPTAGGLEDAAGIDPRTLLLMLDRLDEAALAEARSLLISEVTLTEDGHFTIRPQR